MERSTMLLVISFMWDTLSGSGQTGLSVSLSVAVIRRNSCVLPLFYPDLWEASFRVSMVSPLSFDTEADRVGTLRQSGIR